MLATDWEADNGGMPAPAGAMTKEQLHVAIFELVDTWVDVVDCDACVLRVAVCMCVRVCVVCVHECVCARRSNGVLAEC